VKHHRGALGSATLVAAGVLWVARSTAYWLAVLVGGLVGILLLVGLFHLAAAIAQHHH
jgi:hypothetical protein